jgi:hypothetical protein
MERLRAWARGDVASATSKGIGSILGDIFRLQRMLAVGAGPAKAVRSLPTLLRQISVLTYGNLRVPPPAAHGYE